MSASGMVTGSRGPSPSGSITQTPSPHDVQVPSTSVMRGAAAGAGLARQHPAYDDALAHHMRTQGVGTRLDDTPGY